MYTLTVETLTGQLLSWVAARKGLVAKKRLAVEERYGIQAWAIWDDSGLCESSHLTNNWSRPEFAHIITAGDAQ